MSIRDGFAARRAIVAQPHKTLDHWWDARRITSTTQQTLTDGGRNATKYALTRGADDSAAADDPAFAIGGPITNAASDYMSSGWTPSFTGGLFLAIAFTGGGTMPSSRTLLSSESASVNGMMVQLATTTGRPILFIGDGVAANLAAFAPGDPDLKAGRHAVGILVAADGLSARIAAETGGFGAAVDLTGYTPTHASLAVGARRHVAGAAAWVGDIHQIVAHETAISEADALTVIAALASGDLP